MSHIFGAEKLSCYPYLQFTESWCLTFVHGRHPWFLDTLDSQRRWTCKSVFPASQTYANWCRQGKRTPTYMWKSSFPSLLYLANTFHLTSSFRAVVHLRRGLQELLQRPWSPTPVNRTSACFERALNRTKSGRARSRGYFKTDGSGRAGHVCHISKARDWPGKPERSGDASIWGDSTRWRESSPPTWRSHYSSVENSHRAAVLAYRHAQTKEWRDFQGGEALSMISLCIYYTLQYNSVILLLS